MGNVHNIDTLYKGNVHNMDTLYNHKEEDKQEEELGKSYSRS